MKLSLTTSYPPYGDSWWGIKFSRTYNTIGLDRNLGYYVSLSLTLGLGTKRGWDGYQMTQVIHKYGLSLRYGSIPDRFLSNDWDDDCDWDEHEYNED